MSATPDLSKIVQLIMENPDLVDSISRLAQSDGATEEKAVEAPAPTPVEPVKERVQAPQTNSDAQGKKERRTRLLSALKPYMSGERARAIDSMLSIADVLDVMKTR